MSHGNVEVSFLDTTVNKVNAKCAVILLNGVGAFTSCNARRAMKGIPEPLDYFNHSTNMSLSLIMGLAVSYFGAHVISRFNNTPRRVKAMAVGVGTLAMAGANALTETKLGVSLSHIHNTIDNWDLVYGVAGGFIGANLVECRHPETDQTNGTSYTFQPRVEAIMLPERNPH